MFTFTMCEYLICSIYKLIQNTYYKNNSMPDNLFAKILIDILWNKNIFQTINLIVLAPLLETSMSLY